MTSTAPAPYPLKTILLGCPEQKLQHALFLAPEWGLSRANVWQAGMHARMLSTLLWGWGHFLPLLPAQPDKSTHSKPHGSLARQEVAEWANPLAFTSEARQPVKCSKISIHSISPVTEWLFSLPQCAVTAAECTGKESHRTPACVRVRWLSRTGCSVSVGRKCDHCPFVNHLVWQWQTGMLSGQWLWHLRCPHDSLETVPSFKGQYENYWSKNNVVVKRRGVVFFLISNLDYLFEKDLIHAWILCVGA